MNRSIWYSQEQWRLFDIIAFEHDALLGTTFLTQDILGGTTTVIGGMAATQTGPASLVVNIAAGRIYQQADADATAVGGIPQDTTLVMQQGFYAAGTITLSTSGISAGQSRWALVEAQFSQTDVVRAGDPNGGIPPFYNASNPSQPLNGQGGLGAVSPTEREGLMIIQVITGVAATTGAEVPPTLTGGWVPLYLIDLTFGQTQITNGEILVAGPSVGVNVPSNYPAAPFLAGLLNTHHRGTPGQAPKVILTAGAEVQGVLPTENGGSGTRGFQEYTSPGTFSFTVPSEVFSLEAYVTGSGGGGASSAAAYPPTSLNNVSGAGGGAGGTAIKHISVNPGDVIAVTVAAGGATDSDGATSSLGSFCSGLGGHGGQNLSVGVSSGGTGGGATGGDVNIPGGSGSDGQQATVAGFGNGGASYWGGGIRAFPAGSPGSTAAAFGGGGGGSYNGSATGSVGVDGIVFLKW